MTKGDLKRLIENEVAGLFPNLDSCDHDDIAQILANKINEAIRQNGYEPEN